VALKYYFPDPLKADAEGLVAAGGDLSSEALLTAYSKGIFPWFDSDSQILWWSPDPRMVMFPEKFRISASFRQKIISRKFTAGIDRNFHEVIKHCADARRKGQRGTWITNGMIDAYTELHYKGYAHSFESYHNGELAGGLYGISLGGSFFGESMFYKITDASKVAFFCLVMLLRKLQFDMIDAQQSTAHLKSLGAEDVPRAEFIRLLRESLEKPTIKGSWTAFEKDLSGEIQLFPVR
jgi:leucyl/phenylalanyl-tRNA---protein transferase